MVLDWERGIDKNWQADLWRELFKNEEHKLSLFLKIKEKSNKIETIKNFPKKIFVFGISYLPVFYLNFFKFISKYTKINFFYLNPSIHYFGDIPSKWEKNKLLQNVSSSKKHYLENNSLIESMGILGRDFLDNIIEEFSWIEERYFEENKAQTLLAKIQNDILYLETRDKKIKNDDSIQLHSCHSKIRELDVLSDFLFECFAENKELHPEDILVIMPSIEEYIPYIQSNFSLPFSIFDRNLKKSDSVYDSFLSILNIANSRFEINSILSILENKAILEKYFINLEELDIISSILKN